VTAFDWYAATIRDDPATVVGTLCTALDASPVQMGRGMHGYEQSLELRGRDGVVARVLAGGVNPWPHAWASGDDTDAFVESVRGAWPDWHTVSRVDAADDFGGAGCWDRLLSECVSEAETKNLRIDQAGDWLRDGEHGRTLYIGSKSSPVRARLYEKGKQLRGDGVKDAPIDWVRLELQVRPENQAKWTLATASPSEVWGSARWSRTLSTRVLGVDVDKVDGRLWHEPDDVRALRYLVRQYGPLLDRMRAVKGSWQLVGESLGRLLDPTFAIVAPDDAETC